MPEENLNIKDGRDFWFAAVDICVLRDKTLSFNAKGVYSVLVAFVDIGTRSWVLKTDSLAAECGLSRRTVMYALKELEEHGYIARERRFSEGHQQASLYRIIGHKAECNICTEPIKKPVIDTECNICTEQGAKYAHQLLEPRSLNNTDTTYLEADASDEADEQPELLNSVPLAMRPTAEYLLLKCGRKGLLPTEVGSFMAMEKIHLPSRIQQEIDKAVKRFHARARPLVSLTADYLYESLKHQNSRQRPAAKAVKEKYVQSEASRLEELEHERWMEERYGRGARQDE